MTEIHNESPASFRDSAIRGVLVGGVAQAVKIGTQFLSVIILARLLAPSDFGLMGKVGPVLGFAYLFQDFGLSQATIQRSHITQAQLSTLFWVNVALGTGLAVLLAALSPAVGWFYDDPRAVTLTAASAAMLVLGGLGTQHGALLQRNLRFRALAAIDMATAVTSISVAVAVAALTRSYWALWAGMTSGSLVAVALSWVFARWRPGPPARGSGALALVRFGSDIAGFSILNFFTRNLDNVLIAKRWGDVELGLYDRSYKLLLFPLQNISGPLSRVMMPLLSRLQNDPERYRRSYLKTTHQLLLITIPGIAAVLATTDALIPLLFGPKWLGAIPIFAWLGLAALHQPFTYTFGMLFVSQGRSRDFLYWGVYSTVTTVTAFFVGLPWGATGVAAAYAISDYVVRLPALFYWVSRVGPLRLRDFYFTLAPYLAAAALSAAAIRGVRMLVTPPAVVIVGGGIAIAYGVTAGVLSLYPNGRTVLSETWGLVRKLLVRAKEAG